jgi:hypothetical protein
VSCRYIELENTAFVAVGAVMAKKSRINGLMGDEEMPRTKQGGKGSGGWLTVFSGSCSVCGYHQYIHIRYQMDVRELYECKWTVRRIEVNTCCS